MWFANKTYEQIHKEIIKYTNKKLTNPHKNIKTFKHTNNITTNIQRYNETKIQRYKDTNDKTDINILTRKNANLPSTQTC